MNQEEKTSWEYKPDNGAQSHPLSPEIGTSAPASKPAAAKNKLVTWQATEFIEHEHSSSWYGALTIITVILAALVFLIGRDYVSTGTIVIVGIIVGVFAGHKPQQIQYEVSTLGLKVGDKTYPYSGFKSFAVQRQGGINSIVLYPIKRFMPPVSAYFDPADEKKIIEALGEHLAYEERKVDGIDRLSHRLRL